LGVNKSTISRALKNCRIMTANGVRKADELLVRPLSRSSSDKSQGQALQRLSVMIRAEDKRSPYSDLELVALLRRAGFDLSRRTIAKYRDLLGVPGKTKRRTT
jgi:RNA polymerase sigma-54 factor